MEPGVATELVTTVVAKGKDVLEGCKKRGGTLGFVVKKAETPVGTVLEWKLVKTVFAPPVLSLRALSLSLTHHLSLALTSLSLLSLPLSLSLSHTHTHTRCSPSETAS